MSTFEVKNYTRYNTEDLTGLLDAVDAAVISIAGGAERARLSPWGQGRDHVVSTVVAFKDYTTKTWVPEQKWGAGSNRQRRVFVKPQMGYSRRAENDIRIVPPNKLWTDPLAQLAACAAGNQDIFLPEEARVQLIQRLLTLYSGVSGWILTGLDPRGDRIYEQALSQAPQVRIERKRAAAVGTKEKHRVARHRARRAWFRSDYDVGKLRQYGESLAKSNTSALNTLKRSKVPLHGMESDVDQAVQTLLDAVKGCEIALAALKKTQAPGDGST